MKKCLRIILVAIILLLFVLAVLVTKEATLYKYVPDPTATPKAEPILLSNMTRGGRS